MKKQLKEDLQKLFNQICDIRDEQSKILEELKEMSAEIGLPRYCSAMVCFKQLVGTKYEMRAEMLLTEYQELSGYNNALDDLGGVLADNGFWKEAK